MPVPIIDPALGGILPRRNRACSQTIVHGLAPMLEPIHRQDKVLERLSGEMMWLQQELEKGTITLLFASTQDLYFPYALSQGLLDEWPQIRERIESLYDAVLYQ
jgi:hypothetical protein